MKKGRLITGIILNLLAIGAAAFGILNALFAFFGGGRPTTVLNLVQYFTIDSNALLVLVGIIAIIGEIVALATKKACAFVGALRLIATACVTLTLVVVVAYLAPMKGWNYLYNPPIELWLHLVAPILAIAAFIVDNQPRLRLPLAFLSLIPLAIYGGIMIPLIINGVYTDPYGFLTWNLETWYISVAWYAGLAVGVVVLGLILIALHNIGTKKVVEEAAEKEPAIEGKPEEGEVKEAVEEKTEGVEPAAESEPKLEPAPEPEEDPASEKEPAEEKPAEEKPAETKPAPKTEPVKRTSSVKPRSASYKGKARAYHITKQTSGKWQVKLANGAKAIRVFDTQAEAIAFTKGLVESQGGSFRIHSVKGKIRK